MSDRQVDSRTVVSDSYAPFGVRVDLPDRREPTAEERAAALAADRVWYRELRREWGWSDGDFAIAQKFQFFEGPKAGSRYRDGMMETQFSRRRIGEWVAELRTLLGKLDAAGVK